MDIYIERELVKASLLGDPWRTVQCSCEHVPICVSFWSYSIVLFAGKIEVEPDFLRKTLVQALQTLKQN